MYKVLWIDDEWKTMAPFSDLCLEKYEINLVGYTTRKEGIKALKDDFDNWDAILLDAKMKDESEEEVARLTGLARSLEEIHKLSGKRDIPYFISTGQTGLMDDQTFKEQYGSFYVKDTDDERLIADMLKAMSDQPGRQIKNLYSDIFDAIDNLGMNKESEVILKDILKPLHFPEFQKVFKPKLYYNQIRQLMEYIFRACNTANIIPKEFIETKKGVNLNQCSIYLAGKNADIIGFRYGGEGDRIVPPHIENIIRMVLEFGSCYSHTVQYTKLTKDEEQTLEDYIRHEENSKYIIFGFALLVCELISWFDNFVSGARKNAINYLDNCREIGTRK